VPRLHGGDALFLNLDQPGQPMHSVALVLLAPPTGDGSAPVPLSLEALRSHIAGRLDLVPALRWRVKDVPLGLFHPVAYDDPDFDLGRHLSQVALPAPGGAAELDALVAARSGDALDRSHPMWHMTLVDGLEDGRQALAIQVHHSLMDGIALTNALGVLLSGGGEDATSAAPARPARRRPEPGAARLLAGAAAGELAALARVPGLLGRAAKGIKAVKAYRAAGGVAPPVPGKDAPACSICPMVGPGRRFARAYLPLADVLAVKRAAGVTVGDVAMAVSAGALREYLLARDDLPAKPLLGGVPVAIDTQAAGRLAGNRWSGLVTTLATDVADPWERLQEIARVTRGAKQELALIGVDALQRWMDAMPPFAAKGVVRKEQADAAAHPEHARFNVAVSSLRGPATPLSFTVPAGRVEVEETFFAAVPSNRQCVGFVCSDHGEHLAFAVVTTAEAVPDPTELTAGLHRALAELGEAAGRAVAPALG
jgi:diacylglycerol O-acyltransferase